MYSTNSFCIHSKCESKINSYNGSFDLLMSEMEHDSELANEVEDNAMVNSYYLYYRLAFLLIKLSFFSNW